MFFTIFNVIILKLTKNTLKYLKQCIRLDEHQKHIRYSNIQMYTFKFDFRKFSS